MRRHAKAATAGSSRHQAKGRGRFRMLAAALASLLLLTVVAALAPAAEPPEHLDSFGPDGTAATNFETLTPLAVDQETGAVYVGDVKKQTLYKFDSEGNPLNWGGSAPYISGNEISGRSFNGLGNSQAAVDSETHVVYVTGKGEVQAFEANGEPHEFTAGPGAGTSEIPGASNLRGVAVDKFGTIYASDRGDEKIRIYSRAGALITEFKPTNGGFFVPATVAVADDGALYINNNTSPVHRFVPSQFPVKPSTTYGLGTPLDGVVSYTPATDPTTGYVYVGQTGPRVAVYDEEGNFVGTLGAAGQDGELQGSTFGVAINAASKRAYVTASNPGAGYVKVEVFETFAIPAEAPTVSGTSVTGLTSSSGTLRAKVDPNTLETTYRFEYGLEDCEAKPGACTEVPLGGGSVGSGRKPVRVEAAIAGLSPQATYHYRLVAENSLGVTEGPLRTFRTQGYSFGFELADNRVWEQVTPLDKHGGVLTNASTLRAAADGSGIAFQSRDSIEAEPDGNRALEPSATLARRGAEGWGVEDLVPPYTEATGLGFGPEYKIFSDDLSRALLESRDETPLSPETSERAPHLRLNTDPPAYRPLVTSKEGFANVPPGTVFGGAADGDRNPVSVAGANEDLSHVIVWSRAPLVEGAKGNSLYQWVDGDLKPVSVLPTDEGGDVVFAQLGSGVVSGTNAVSQDGSIVFWAPGDNSVDIAETAPMTALYVRDMEAGETARIDVVQPGVSGTGEVHPTFMGASADGTVVFFTDRRRLTADASAEGRSLYRCEVQSVGGSLTCGGLENLSVPLGAEKAEVQELSPGMSEDGRRVYFLAAGVLDAEPNEHGDGAQAGSPNLYLWDEEEGVRFIASLSSKDGPAWGEPGAIKLGHASKLSADASPSGRYLTFMSERNLTGAESADPATGEPVEQAFLYDAIEDELRCISCNPAGSTDSGYQIAAGVSDGGVILPDPMGLWSGRWVGATLPEPTESEPSVGYAFYHPRAVLDNGRAFFNSVAPLALADSNGTWDVYQYEPFGVGSCTPASSSASTAVSQEGGCVGLFSSGADDEPSVFMDASESGGSVFFATFAQLSVLDKDDIVDVYDARVNGVAAVAEPNVECLGEACQPAAVVPNDPTPASTAFKGQGNVKPNVRRRCAKGQRKLRRKGKVRCVARKGRKAHQRRRAGR